MNDRQCNHFIGVSSFVHCGRLHCIVCYNWHVKWVHGAKFAYSCERGVLIETNYPFYPPPDKKVDKIVYFDPLDELSDEQLVEVERLLKLKMQK
jgi:hypothetical protein